MQTHHRRGGGWVIAQFALLAAIGLAPRDLPGLPSWPAWLARAGLVAGLLLGAAGGTVALLGARGLGPNLTPFPRPRDNGRLVQNGIYGAVRHPIYGGLLLAALGWSLVRGSTPALVLSLGLAVFFDRKAHHEERWLLEKFPEYAAYRRRVRKLVPWIY